MDEKSLLKSAASPRATAMTGTCWALFTIPITLCIVLVAVVVIVGLPEYYRILAFTQRSVSTVGEVTGSYITTIHERNLREPVSVFHLKYIFRPKGLSTTDGASISSEQIVSLGAYSTLSIGAKVPVIYDPLRPDRCILNFGDPVDRMDSGGILRGYAIAATAIFLFFAFLILLVAVAYLRQKHRVRWWAVAEATIIGEREHLERGWRVVTLTYQFRDAAGNFIQGVRKNIPGSYPDRSDIQERRARFVDTPLVLFDPQKSARNVLYPMALVRLQAR